jgi:hypothetical protein
MRGRPVRLWTPSTWSTCAVFLGFLAPLPALAATQPQVVSGPFAPADRCTRQPGAAAFRTALARAVRGRDVRGFVALTTPAVRLDFGGGGGHAELRRRLSGADGRQLWRELDRIVPLGCAVQAGNLVMPSVFAHDFGDIDPFEVMVVTGSQVPLRAAPSPTARTLRLLSWIAVTPLSADDFDKPFRRVSLPGGKVTGYVAAARLRSPLDYRLIASRRRGAWKIDAFLAGD